MVMIGPAQTSHGLTRAPCFFVGSHDVGFHFGIAPADAGRAARRQPDRLLVSVPVQHEPAPVHPGAHAGANLRRPLADTAAEDDRVGSA